MNDLITIAVIVAAAPTLAAIANLITSVRNGKKLNEVRALALEAHEVAIKVKKELMDKEK